MVNLPAYFFVIPQADLLHPLTSLRWKECDRLPCDVKDVQIVCFDGRIYLGGLNTFAIYCSNDDMKSWKEVKTPTCHSALTTYDNQLVLVGGQCANGQITNQLFSLQEDDEWASKLPSMLIPRMCSTALSYHHHLLIAGGKVHGEPITEVEVFDGNSWFKTEHIPQASVNMKSATLNDKWYLTGETSTFCASIDTLINVATFGKSPTKVWKSLPPDPFSNMSIVAYKGFLLAIGGGQGIFRLYL